jgi:LysM repeat protein
MQGGCKKDEPKAPDIMAGQPAVPPDPYYTDPSQLTPTNPGPGTGIAPAPTDAFGAPTTAIGPATPMPPGPTTTSLPPTSATPVVDMGFPTPGSPTGLPTMAEPAPAMQQYKIAKGDNFYTIAKKLGTTTKKILDANPNVDPARLQIGQSINVPVSTTAAPSMTTAASSFSGPSATTSGGTSMVTYEVKAGDSLYGIAIKHGTTVKAIQAANGLKTTRINVKQKLKVPTKASASAPAPEPVMTAPASFPTSTPTAPLVPGNQ